MMKSKLSQQKKYRLVSGICSTIAGIVIFVGLTGYAYCGQTEKVLVAPLDTDAIKEVCLANAPNAKIIVQRSIYDTFPTEDEVWRFCLKSADDVNDPRYKYIGIDGKPLRNVCGYVSSDFAKHLKKLKPDWPVGEAYSGRHWVNCAVTSDKGLVFFDPMKSGIISFFPKQITIY